MRNYEERAKDFIKVIFPYIKNYMDSPYDIRRRIRQFNDDKHRKVIVDCGCARIALITSDYVVKFEYDEDEVKRIGGCKNEVYLYDVAEREGFAYLFAKITHVVWQGYNFYVMPRIEGIDECNGHAWQYMTAKESNWCKNHSLTDLHGGNYGLRNGHVCIIDYAFQEDLVEDCESDSYYIF